jgi:precorrin-6B methylase 2
MMEQLLTDTAPFLPEAGVFVESGCGLTTIALAKMARRYSAYAYSLDYNPEKIEELKSRAGREIENVEFLIGDSVQNLPKLVDRHAHIDFLFLDSAASAMHTFREFQIVEPAFRTGSRILVDNAALPKEENLLSPVRKGKILVPYLLASAYWEVLAHPTAGDSMISAILHNEGRFADPEFEHPEYADRWRELFERSLAA